MRKILILLGSYLPGHKDGGPLRTIINLTEALGDEYDFYIGCYDRDHGDVQPYSNIKREEWNSVGKAKVRYVSPGGFSSDLILQLAEDMDMIYLCSFYEEYGYKTLLLNRRRKLKSPVVLASMGVFSDAALHHKAMKKRLFIAGCKLLHLFDSVTWSVTSELEANDVKRTIHSDIHYIVAEDLPRLTVPGRKEKPDGTLKIVFLSRICAHKNLDFAIRAISNMKRTVEFTIYGPIQEKDYWKHCQQILSEVHFKWTYAGDVPSEGVQEKLSHHDVLVLPSKSENFGHVVFEALSVGCIPVISDQTPWKTINEERVGYELPLEEAQFTETLDSLAEMSLAERCEMVDRAIDFARKKALQSVKETGYRAIFG